MEKRYTAKEIDELRTAVEIVWFRNYSGRIYAEPWPEKTSYIEKRVRTYMMAGLTANDILSENPKKED